VGNDVAIRLAASIEALTSTERKNKTWREIPGEAPKQTDLLVAFVEAVPDVPMAEVMIEDYSQEEPEASSGSH
jgi:hypothetical protein